MHARVAGGLKTRADSPTTPHSTRSFDWAGNIEKRRSRGAGRNAIILDTDILTLIQRGRGEEYTHLIERIKAVGDTAVCVTIVTFEEQLRGWLAWIRRARELLAYQKLQEMLDDVQPPLSSISA